MAPVGLETGRVCCAYLIRYVSRSSLACGAGDGSVNPNAPAVCDNQDKNCNALIDDGLRSTVVITAAPGFPLTMMPTPPCARAALSLAVLKAMNTDAKTTKPLTAGGKEFLDSIKPGSESILNLMGEWFYLPIFNLTVPQVVEQLGSESWQDYYYSAI